MTQTLSIWLGPSIIYVYGTVNGEAATFTLAGDGVWEATVPRAGDDRYTVYVEAYSASGLEYSLTRAIQYLEGWVTPKTDWTARDRENASDFNRQKHNIGYIATEVLPSLYYFPAHTEIDDVDMPDYPFVSLVNALEGNLQAVEGSGVTLPPGWEPSKVWAAGGRPDWRDANRWERNMLLMYEMARLVMTRFRVAGTFSCGQSNILPRKVM